MADSPRNPDSHPVLRSVPGHDCQEQRSGQNAPYGGGPDDQGGVWSDEQEYSAYGRYRVLDADEQAAVTGSAEEHQQETASAGIAEGES
jgi:hypothetical protein